MYNIITWKNWNEHLYISVYSVFRPLHMCVTTCNVVVVKKWIEIATAEEIAEAIDIPSSAGTALCMAAALKKDRERGNNSNLSIDIP